MPAQDRSFIFWAGGGKKLVVGRQLKARGKGEFPAGGMPAHEQRMEKREMGSAWARHTPWCGGGRARALPRYLKDS